MRGLLEEGEQAEDEEGSHEGTDEDLAQDRSVVDNDVFFLPILFSHVLPRMSGRCHGDRRYDHRR